MNSTRLQSLQVARGGAACLVFFMHLFNMASVFSGSPITAKIAYVFQQFGNFGVDLFFVLSGLVISKVAVKAARTDHGDRIKRIGSFIAKRAIRVYPLYWVTLFCLISLPALPGVDNSIATLMGNPSSLFLLTAPAAHSVAWTLVYEVQFYLVACVVMLFGRRAKSAFIAWTALQVGVVSAAHFGFLPKIPITDALTLEFCFGVLIGFIDKRDIVKFPITTILLTFVAMVALTEVLGSVLIATDTNLRAMLWGIPAGIIVLSLVSSDETRATKPNLLSHLGDISYSIYMWHLVVLIVVERFLTSLSLDNPTLYAALFVSLGAALTLAISYISYKFMEKPAIGMMNTPRMSASASVNRPAL